MVSYTNPYQYYWYQYSGALYFWPILLVAVLYGLNYRTYLFGLVVILKLIFLLLCDCNLCIHGYVPHKQEFFYVCEEAFISVAVCALLTIDKLPSGRYRAVKHRINLRKKCSRAKAVAILNKIISEIVLAFFSYTLLFTVYLHHVFYQLTFFISR